MKYFLLLLLVCLFIGGCNYRKPEPLVMSPKTITSTIEKNSIDTIVDNLKKDEYSDLSMCFDKKCFSQNTEYINIHYPSTSGHVIINNGINIQGDVFYTIVMNGSRLIYNNIFALQIPSNAEYFDGYYDIKNTNLNIAITVSDIQVFGGDSMRISRINSGDCNDYNSGKLSLYYTDISHQKEAVKRGVIVTKYKELGGRQVSLLYKKFCYSHEEMFPTCNYQTPWTVDACLPTQKGIYDIHIPANSKKELDVLVSSIKIL